MKRRASLSIAIILGVVVAALTPTLDAAARPRAQCPPGQVWVPKVSVDVDPQDEEAVVEASETIGRCVDNGTRPGKKGVRPISRPVAQTVIDRVRVSACISSRPDQHGQVPRGGDICTTGSDTCNPPGTPAVERRWYFRVWQRERSGPPRYLTVGEWRLVGYECYRPDRLPPDELVEQRPRLTWVDVYNAVKNEAAAKKRVLVQPVGKTLVNAETVFSTSGDDWTKYGLVLLGFRVDVEGSPTSYLWRFGDGESLTTASAGRPYPAKDITHKYMRKAERLGVTVATTYKVRYRVDGGAWQDIEQPLVATGPVTPLGVREAIAVLVDPEG